jgi:hypothetical protein
MTDRSALLAWTCVDRFYGRIVLEWWRAVADPVVGIGAKEARLEPHDRVVGWPVGALSYDGIGAVGK